MTDYCVAPSIIGSGNGSDWNNCAPWSSMSFTRGNTYYLKDGTYTGKTLNTAASGSTLITIKKATQTDHVTDIGWTSADGDGQAAFTSRWYINSPYWIIDGVTGGGPSNWSGPYGFKITETGASNACVDSSSDHWSMSHTELVGMDNGNSGGGSAGNDAFALRSGSNNITLSYLYTHGIGRCPIWAIAGISDLVLEYSWIDTFWADADPHGEIFSSIALGDCTFRYNLFTDVKSTGGLMWDNNDNHSAVLRVHGNVFYRPSGYTWVGGNGVIGGFTGGSGEDCYTMRIYNNTFIDVNILIFTNFIIRSGDNIAYNNIFYNCNSPDYADIQTHDYNHYINSGGDHSEANGTSAASGDPFVNYIALNFALSAATTAGKNDLGSPYNIDPLGLTRGSDGTWDRGAYEYGGTPSSSRLPRHWFIS